MTGGARKHVRRHCVFAPLSTKRDSRVGRRRAQRTRIEMQRRPLWTIKGWGGVGGGRNGRRMKEGPKRNIKDACIAE
jgi:hypothetical protein